MTWTSRWLPAAARARLPELVGMDETVERILAWLRSVVVEPDVLLLDVPGFRGCYAFTMPSLPGARPSRLDPQPDPARIRFVLRSSRRSPADLLQRWNTPAPDVDRRSFLSIFRLADLELLERNSPHGGALPLRLGIGGEEAGVLFAHARKIADRALSESDPNKSSAAFPPNDWPQRFRQRCGVGLAIWTRGELRGSVVSAPAPLWRALSEASEWVCRDRRFKPLSREDLAQSRLQVSLLHAPRVPLPRAHIDSRSPCLDKAFFAHEGTRAGVYVPEIFNLRRLPTMQALASSLAVEKAGLPSFSSRTVLEVCQVQEFIESADRSRTLALHGPIAVAAADDSLPARARRSGIEACRWLATLQRDDGSLPLRVNPRTGRSEGDDRTRAAMTAHAAAAFGRRAQCDQAVEIGERALSWLERTAHAGDPARVLLTSVYQGKLALALGRVEAARKALQDVRALLPAASFEPLAFSHVASFMRAFAAIESDQSDDCELICARLSSSFDAARRAGKPMPLALWAELVPAFPIGSARSQQAAEWLAGRQLDSGAFPNTTASDFAYTRGTGKVFEVLASCPAVGKSTIERCLEWLLSMQYNADSMFFVPEAHQSLVGGGFRHDAFDTDAWIDAAGHVLLGLARWEAA